jgi:hypothetical protein
MPGKSKLAADAAEQATLRGLSKSEQRSGPGPGDRADAGGAAGRRSRRDGWRTNRATGVCLASAAPHPQRAAGGRGEPSAPCRSEDPSRGGGDRSGVPRRIRGAHPSLSGAPLDPARHRVAHPSARPDQETGHARRLRSAAPRVKLVGCEDPRRLLVHTSATKRSTDPLARLDQLGAPTAPPNAPCPWSRFATTDRSTAAG